MNPEQKEPMKLELKHLAPYLPYGLKVKKGNGFIQTLSVYGRGEGSSLSILNVLQGMGKPLLMRLDSLIEKVADWLFLYERESFDVYESCRFWVAVQIKEPLEMPFNVFNKFCELQGDVFGLIDEGLAIDINTLKP